MRSWPFAFYAPMPGPPCSCLKIKFSNNWRQHYGNDRDQFHSKNFVVIALSQHTPKRWGGNSDKARTLLFLAHC